MGNDSTPTVYLIRRGVIRLKADTITKAYVQDVNIFADIFNYIYIKGSR